MRSLCRGRADLHQTRRGDISGQEKTRVPWTGHQSEWGHTLVFFAPGRITPLMTLMTALPTPGKPAVKSTHALSSAPVYILTHRNAGVRPQPQGHREAGEWSPKELPGPVCPQSSADLGSSVSTLREEMLSFTSSCRHSVVHRKMQPTGQVSRAGKTSISAEMSTLSTELILRLITLNKPPLE